jgi:hypothetical protein
MNGRIYDPTIGRFMSADPSIQAPYELQSHNRYAYVMNNPLLYTDPSGYSWKSFFTALVVIVAVVVTMGAAAYAIMGATAFSSAFAAGGLTAVFAAAGAAYGGMGAIMIGAASGFVGGFLGAALNGASLSDSLKAGVIGGITGAAMAWAGGVGGVDGSSSAGRYLAHAAVGCGSSLASGGGANGCARGAAAAVVGHAITNGTSGWNNPAARFAAASVSGGVTSRIMGGSFANGAQTAAYGFLFNELLHQGDRQAAMRRSGYADSGSSLANTAMSEIGDKSWAVDSDVMGRAGANKCNIFVYDNIIEIGQNGPEFSRFSISRLSTETQPILAGMWADTGYDPQGTNTGWAITSVPRSGDVFAYAQNYGNASGHTGIYLGAGNGVWAGQYTVNTGALSTAFPNKNIVYRTYVGK